MREWKDLLFGLAELEYGSAEPEQLLNRAAGMGLRLRRPRRVDRVTLRFFLPENQLDRIREAAARGGGELRILSRRGGSRLRGLLRRRIGLLVCLAATLSLFWGSSLFLWDFRVLGCETLTKGQVLRALSDCGVDQGCFWPGVDVDLLRSRMLLKLPELKWMTLRCTGSRATVLVVERGETPGLPGEGRADLVAGKSGQIASLSVLRGREQVSPGQMVTKGELLVSGLVESITAPPREVYALGNVWAETWPELIAVCPAQQRGKETVRAHTVSFALKIGKNRWNFPFYTGNTLDECDTIVHEYKLGMEGLFSLPVSLIREDRIRWEESVVSADLRGEMEAHLKERLEGRVLSCGCSAGERDGLLFVALRAHCLEDIAVTVTGGA